MLSVIMLVEQNPLVVSTELIYKEVISYESPERHGRTGVRGVGNSVQNHTSGVNHNPGMFKLHWCSKYSFYLYTVFSLSPVVCQIVYLF